MCFITNFYLTSSVQESVLIPESTPEPLLLWGSQEARDVHCQERGRQWTILTLILEINTGNDTTSFIHYNFRSFWNTNISTLSLKIMTLCSISALYWNNRKIVKKPIFPYCYCKGFFTVFFPHFNCKNIQRHFYFWCFCSSFCSSVRFKSSLHLARKLHQCQCWITGRKRKEEKKRRRKME